MPTQLNLVMIARDEERCIERALRSVADVVDAMIVLDTGSHDRTREIARGCGAVVAEWAWRDDFAAARNAAQDLSDADVNLIMDADEWLAPEAHDAVQVARASERRDHVGLATVASTSQADGHEVASATLSERFLPRGVRYAGKVHEQPHHDRPTYLTSVVLRHDGYEPAQRARKGVRNEELLQAELRRRPADAYLHYQLGKEMQAGQRWHEAAQCYQQALAGVPANAPWGHALVVRALSVLGKSGRFGEAVALFDREQEAWGHSPDFHFAAGNLFLDIALADPASAGELLGLVEASWLRCLEIGERPDLPGSVTGRGSTLAAGNLASLYEMTGDPQRARRYRDLARS